MRQKLIMTAMLVLALAFSLAAGAQTTPTPTQSSPEGIDRGGYNIQQSIELGYRFTDITTPHNGGDDTAMFNTFINLHQGPRVLEQTFSMRSLENSGVLFDNFYVNSFGWGGDPNNVVRARVEKNKFYNFNGSFRRDQNFFDYNMLANPMNNPLTAAGLGNFPVLSSPHSFAVTRRAADMNLTILPQSRFTMRLGYSRNRADGPSTISNHEAGDTLMYAPWNTTYQTWNLGFDMKFIPKTNISFDQFLQYGKNDTNNYLDPTTGVGSFATFPFANPTVVGGFPAVEFGLIPTPSCILATGYASTGNCSGYFNYNREQRLRTSTPTSQLSFQSRPHEKVELTGRFSYSSMDMKGTYDEVFNGLVTRTREKSWTITGPVRSQIITGSGDFGITIHVTDKLSLSNTFRFLNERSPSMFNGAESILAVNGGTATFASCIDPATGKVILGTATTQCKLTNEEITEVGHLNQNLKFNTTELAYDFTRAFGARVGYRVGTKAIGMFTERGTEAWDITEHTGTFAVWVRPSNQFRANAEFELMSNSGVDTRIVPRNQQHYRFRATYQPMKELSLSGTANILENRNGMAEVNYKGHNHNLGFTAIINPSKKFSLDFSYNYSNYIQNAFMCFVDNVNAAQTAAGFVAPGVAGACPTTGYLYSTPDYTWSGANPASRYLYSTFEDINHSGSFTVQLHPVQRVTAILGYGFTKVDGSTQQLNQVVGLGPLNYTYHQPLASLSIEMAKNWSFNTYYNYDQYNEGSFTGPTAPRYFHDNRATLAVRYAF